MKKVYIIDDDRMFLNLLSKTLWELGYTVKTFLSVEEALPCLEETPDVIILDHHFEANNTKGLEFIKILKSNTKKCPILYISADNDTNLINDSLMKGADIFLRKNKYIFKNIPEAIEKLLLKKKGKQSFIFKSIFG